VVKIKVTKTEFVWSGKYNDNRTRREVPRVNLPFQIKDTHVVDNDGMVGDQLRPAAEWLRGVSGSSMPKAHVSSALVESLTGLQAAKKSARWREFNAAAWQLKDDAVATDLSAGRFCLPISFGKLDDHRQIRRII
jgi:hypothetical protein